MLSFLLLLLSLLLFQSTYISSTAIGNSSFLQLNVGLNLSIAGFFDAAPIETGFRTLVAIPGSDDRIFLPILSSPGFNTTDAVGSSGFSFGFMLSSETFFSDIYLVVCGGLSGNYSNALPHMPDQFDGGLSIDITLDGYAEPMWVANVNTPLLSMNASLVVLRGGAPGSGNVLQLRDHMGRVVWSVKDVGLMEMQDTGNLIIYDTLNKTKVVWESLNAHERPRDSLIQGQKLTVGMELRSNDSAYLARMEKGGLVFYLNKPQFIEHPAPYWVIPILSLSTVSKQDLKKLVLDQSLCGPQNPGYMVLVNFPLTLDLKPGECTIDNTTSSIQFQDTTFFLFSFTWFFVKLEIDGRLYMYGVDTRIPQFPRSVSRFVVDKYAHYAFADWGDCAAPMACGPLGVCKPFNPSLCACPHASPEGIILFDFTNTSDFSKGCKLVTPLPECIQGNEHISTTSYLQLNETASTFLFSGWPFPSTTSKRVDKCMELCSSNCSCTGFFYQATSFACFFITDGIGLLHTIDRDKSVISDVNSQNGNISASDYITYLKIYSKSSGKHDSTIVIAVVSSVVASLLTVGSVLYLFHARKSKRKSKARDKAKQEEEEQLQDILPLLPSRFSYQDLHEATKGFSTLLGAGGCGSVYAGVLLDGRKVAVKMLEAGLLKGQQSKQFLAEVATVGRTSHHNIVCLVGFCWEVYHRLLVYEYMERGSLDQWLFARGDDVAKGAEPASKLLDWQTRYRVALGIARGLTYLHEECPQPILHFDIKPQNILLDDAYVAKLADFGLSKLMQRGISEVVTGVRGTPGYIAPEWLSHGAVSKKSDMYSMGMVLLEIVGGRKNVDIKLLNSACDEWHFPSWAARECEQGLMLELVDKRIAQAYDEEQACRLIQTAFWCIHQNASMRPSAPAVVQWLEGSCIIKQPPFLAIAHAQSSMGSSSLSGGPNAL